MDAPRHRGAGDGRTLLGQATPSRVPLSPATLLLTLIIGCASPGPPKPPSLHLALIVQDLSASRVGDTVELHWSTSTETTDSLPVPGGLTAELCSTPYPTSSAATPACLPRIAVQPGPGALTHTLTTDLRSGPPRAIAYRIQIFNAAGRSAGASSEALSIAGPPLPPIRDLHLTPVERGVRLEWPADPPPVTVDLERLDLTPPSPVGPPTRAPRAGARPVASVHLRAEEQGLLSPIVGTMDTSVAEGQTYRYTAQRRHSITLSGHTLDQRSQTSAPATVTIHDTFPPRTPRGLAAVPSVSPSVATATPAPVTPPPATATIDLSWEPDTEPDLAGYIVSRSPAADASASIRLTPQPLAAPAFRDTTAVSGTRYRYRVSAVDRSGNESPPSEPVEETAQQP